MSALVPPMSKVIDVAAPGGEAEVPAGDDPAREARAARSAPPASPAAAASMRPPFDFRSDAGPEKPRAARPASSSPARRRDDRGEVGVDDGRRRALVLAPDRRGAVRDRDGTPGKRSLEERGEAPLVRRVGEREEQADGDRDVSPGSASSGATQRRDPLELRVVERRHDRAVGGEPLADAEAVGPRGERLRLRAAQVVRILLVDPPDRRHVLEARRREQQHARALALEQRVRADGRAERDRGERAPASMPAASSERKIAAAGSAGVDGSLRDDEPARLVVEHDEVGERAAGVDARVERHASASGRAPP